MNKEELKSRLLARTCELEDGCWEWQGCCGSHGYGQITFKTKGMTTNRAAYEVFNGEIPQGMFVCHTCDYRRCINPEHLFLGTPQDNIDDMITKGRAALDNNRKLSDDQILKIRELYFKDISQQEIARLFDISQATVSRIGTGYSYGWIS